MKLLHLFDVDFGSSFLVIGSAELAGRLVVDLDGPLVDVLSAGVDNNLLGRRPIASPEPRPFPVQFH